jgi:OOP family OmpA-OmpF porin
MKQKIKLILLFAFLIALSSTSLAQGLEEGFFKDAKARLADAEKENVSLMSPTYYGDALKNFKSAEKKFKEGASLNDIKEQLAEVNTLLDKAYKTAEVGKVTFASVLKVRNDAVKAVASSNVPELWIKAESKLKEAGEELEDGDVNNARELANEAENIFRDAELEAIKKSYLVETRNKIKLAEDKKVNKTAPVTLALAKKLVKDCEKELNENRYDTDLPRSLAKQAQYEINHAFYIDKVVNKFNDKDETLESHILAAEKELGKIAASIEVEEAFDNGLAPVADKILEKTKLLKSENDKYKQTISNLENEVKVLKDELSGLSAEKSELAGRMNKLNIIKQKYDTVEKMFTDDQAQVLRKENDIIIRLVGLSFDVGKSVIKPQNFSLLTKLQKAIKEFPEGIISVEGHTDSFGSDAVNMALSKDRANAVLEYLLANMDISRSRISAAGFGETKPIANNETVEGRAKNRRIDLVIKNN